MKTDDLLAAVRCVLIPQLPSDTAIQCVTRRQQVEIEWQGGG